MIGGNYYCLLAGLPEIGVDDKKLSLTVSELRVYLSDYLTSKEMKTIDLFFLPNDNRQFLRILNKEEPEANLETVFDPIQLEEEIADPMFIPSYMKSYLSEIQDVDAEPLQRLPELELSERYWEYMCRQKNSFVRKYARFSMNIKNLITALNCRKHRIDIEKEVIGKNPFSEALRTSHAPDFELTDDYPYVSKILSLFEKENIAEREYGIDMLYWEFLDQETEHRYFSFENVIAFLLKLLILERWSKMTTEQGRSRFEELLERFKTDFRFSKEFEL